nr:unnamed protein product [Digitaria exilis]CAB3495081.1 unnamed protein product [Digitaria exilis]
MRICNSGTGERTDRDSRTHHTEEEGAAAARRRSLTARGGGGRSLKAWSGEEVERSREPSSGAALPVRRWRLAMAQSSGEARIYSGGEVRA